MQALHSNKFMKFILIIYKELKLIFQKAILDSQKSHHRGNGSGWSPLANLTLENKEVFFFPLFNPDNLQIIFSVIKILFKDFKKLSFKTYCYIVLTLVCLVTIVYNILTAFFLFFKTSMI